MIDGMRFNRSISLVTGLANHKGSGREKFRSETLQVLSEFQKKFEYFQFIPKKPNRLKNLFTLKLDGLVSITEARFSNFIDQIPRNGIILFDGSNYGVAVKKIKIKRPDLYIIVLYHNIESLFFYHSFKYNFRLKSLMLSLYYYLQETLSARYSDHYIFLTERDYCCARKIYVVKKKSIVPLSVHCSEVVLNRCIKGLPLRLLFVGGAFYANIEGVKWVCRLIKNNQDVHLTIVGKGFDEINILKQDNVSLNGYVDDLNVYYSECDIVINPIFSGSGMKTKIAEAMYFGKPILTTNFGLNGYELVASAPYLFIANTRTQWLEILQKLILTKINGQDIIFHNDAIEDYKSYYSRIAYKKNLIAIFNRMKHPN